MKKWFKKCPFCANEIKEWAIKCQYCWEWLEDKTKKEKITEEEERDIEDTTELSDTEKKDLKTAENNMNTAFIFWCIWVWFTIILSIVQENYSWLIWVLYFWILLYFLRRKKNRIAALFLFIEYVLDTIYAYTSWGKIWILWLLILAWLFMWAKWAFSYNKIKGNTRLSTTDIVLLTICSIITTLIIIWLLVWEI